MQTHKLLTPAKQSEAEKKKPHYIKGKELSVNAGSQQQYVKELTSMVKKMTADVEKRISLLFKGNTAKVYFATDASIASQARILTNSLTFKWDSIFAAHAKPKAKKMVKQQSNDSSTDLTNSLKQLSDGLVIDTDILSGPLKDITTASIAENVSLIKSIPQQYLHQVKGSVMRSITTGNGLQDLIPELQKYKGITKRRAKNIALDQTRKVYNNIGIARSQEVGLEEGEWLHSGGGIHPRETHIGEMNGQIFKLKDGLYDPDLGYNIQPGEEPNCKCTWRPVLKFGF